MSAFWNNAFIILGGIASVLIVLEFFGAKEWLAKLKPLSKVRVFLLLAALVVLAIGIYGKVAAASVTFGNIEDKVRVWLDDVKLQPYKVDDINAFFHFE